MTGIRSFPALSRSDGMSGDTSPPDHVKKTSQDLENESGQDEESHKAPESDSDSGDSLFITQQPVPEAVRSKRQRGHTLKSRLISPRHLEESEDDISSSASDEQPRADQKKRPNTMYKYKIHKLPKYGFPFLSEYGGKSSGLLPHLKNKTLHDFTMGGFFKCVKELWPPNHGKHPQELSLPTVDKDGECISPLSEEEERYEDIKVVEKKCFLAPSKAKKQQTWGEPSPQQMGRRKTTKTRPEPSSGTQETARYRADVLSPHTRTSDDAGSPCGVSVETEKNEEEELCNDNDAIVSRSPRIQGCQRQYTQNSKEASTGEPEPQSNLHNAEILSHTGQSEDEPESLPNLIDDTVADSVCSKRDERKKNDEEDQVEEAKSQNEEEPEGLHPAACVNVEEEQSFILYEDNSAELLALQTGDNLEVNERNSLESSALDGTILREEEGDVTRSEQKKKKSEEEDLRQEVNRDSESLSSPSCNVDNSGKKKKKREKSGEDDEDMEQCQPSTADEHGNDDTQIQMKKKKRKVKDRVVVTHEREEDEALKRTFDFLQKEDSENFLENTAAFQETSESKRKKHKKKRRLSSDDATQDGEGVDVGVSNDAVGLEESAELSPKKKKKKKKAVPEGWTVSDDNVAQSDDSVSVRKKEKKRTSSFLVADAEEKDAQPHGEEQNSPSQPVDALVWAAGDFQTLSAEITGDSVESVGVRKKKKKKKRKIVQDGLDRDHEQDFEDANTTCQNSLPEGDDTGGKRKKKHKKNESEFLTPMEIQESAPEADQFQTEEPVVLKKKKKKKKCKDESDQVVQESPAAEDTESEQSTVNTCIPHKKKRKHRAEISDHGSTSDQAAKETLAEHASPSSEMFNEARAKKKKKMKSTENTVLEESETQESKQMEDTILKKKHRTGKRRLHNPSEALLT